MNMQERVRELELQYKKYLLKNFLNIYFLSFSQ